MIDFFSSDYFTARDRFRSGVLANGGQIESILLNAKGPMGQDLTIDIGWFGTSNPDRAFIHASGVHGVEGFAGSAIQLQWLEEGITLPSDECAVGVVHVMNPYGMAWLRLVNENNVDVNRNFLAADEEYSGVSENYEGLRELLNPVSPPAGGLFGLLAAWRAFRLGKRNFRRATTGSQYNYPKALAYGGRHHEQATRCFQLYISGRLAFSERVVVVDVHTGAGKLGEDSLLVDGADCRLENAAAMQLAWGDRVRAMPEPTRGSLDGLFFRMFPAARVCFAMQEFGTCSEMAALAAARTENWQHHFGDPAELDSKGKEDLLRTFCPESAEWRTTVLERGREVIHQGLKLAFDTHRPAATLTNTARQLPPG